MHMHAQACVRWLKYTTGTDFLLTNTLDLTLKESRNVKVLVIYFVSESFVNDYDRL